MMSGPDPESEPFPEIKFPWLFSCLCSSSTWWDEKKHTGTACLSHRGQLWACYCDPDAPSCCRVAHMCRWFAAKTVSGSHFSALTLPPCPALTSWLWANIVSGGLRIVLMTYWALRPSHASGQQEYVQPSCACFLNTASNCMRWFGLVRPKPAPPCSGGLH